MIGCAWHCPNVCKHSHSPLVCDKTENLNFSKTKFSFCWLTSLSVRDGFIRVDVCKHRSVVLMMAGISDLSKFKNRTEPRVKRQLMLKWLIHWFILLYWTWEATLQRKRIFIFWVYSSSVVGSVRASSGSDNLYWKARGERETTDWLHCGPLDTAATQTNFDFETSRLSFSKVMSSPSWASVPLVVVAANLLWHLSWKLLDGIWP